MSKFRKPLTSALLLFATSLPLQAAELETLEQRFSYALGFQFSQQLVQQGLDVDSAAFAAALDDALQGKETQLTPEQMSAAFREMRVKMQALQQEQAEAAKQAGEAFLAQNKSASGVEVLPSGLQYQVLRAGDGEKPTPGSTVTVHYRGTLISGKEFDSSYNRGEPASFSLNGVIPGFREGISNMKTGGKWKLFIPSELGYGATGAPGAIGPNEALIFEVELISFEAPAAADAKAEK